MHNGTHLGWPDGGGAVNLPPAAGAMVMAVGIFGVGALQRLPGATVLIRPVACLAVALWIVLAILFLLRLVRRELRPSAADPVRGFGYATWPPATAVIADLLRLAWPGAPMGLAIALGAATLLLWLWLLPQATRWLGAVLGDPVGQRARGQILLAAVSTQALALTGDSVLPPSSAEELGQFLLCLGLLIYGGEAFAVMRAILGRAWNCVIADWGADNCILHGGLSIAGLTALSTPNTPIGLALGLWLAAAGVVVLVEAMEILHLAARLRHVGWRAVVAFGWPQWSRIFTLGMFEAFTNGVAVAAARHHYPWVVILCAPVLRVGPELVAGLLLVELLLMAGRGHLR